MKHIVLQVPKVGGKTPGYCRCDSCQVPTYQVFWKGELWAHVMYWAMAQDIVRRLYAEEAT